MHFGDLFCLILVILSSAESGKAYGKLKHENKKDKKRLGNLDIEDLDAEYRAIVE